jgi:pilus assembly protein CpaC
MGKSPGSTDIIMLGNGGQTVVQTRIDVDIDVSRIEAQLARLLSGCTLEVGQSEGVLVVSGTLARAEQIERLHEFLDAHEFKYVDMTTLAGVQQVQVQIRIAEASRTALRALGINALATGQQDNTFFGASLVGSAAGGAMNPITIGPPAGTLAGPQNAPFTFNADVNVSPVVTLLAGFPRADLEFFIQALAENQYLRILAEPTLIALSGEEASFLAGGEFPIPVVQGTIGGGGTSITIEYKEFGVRLSFRPTVLGDNTIRLHVAPEVSDLSDQGAVEIQGFRIPAVITRRAETTLELHSGETFAMAGLLQESNQARNSRIPGLGDLPILGALFRSVRYEKRETELLVLVTASLVEPLALASVPPLPGDDHVPPNDWELYGVGRIEGQAPANISPDDAEQFQEAGLDRLKGPGTWASYGQPDSESRSTLEEVRAPTSSDSKRGLSKATAGRKSAA